MSYAIPSCSLSTAVLSLEAANVSVPKFRERGVPAGSLVGTGVCIGMELEMTEGELYTGLGIMDGDFGANFTCGDPDVS